jgi:RHS repeat-associated protein
MKRAYNKIDGLIMQIAIVVLFVFVIGIQASVAVKIFSRDEALTESNMSKPRIYIQNTGTVALNDVKIYYYFTTENGKTPLLENYYSPGFSIALLPVSGDNYKIEYILTGTLGVGEITPDIAGSSVGLHYNTWDAWDKTNDYSNSQSASFSENTLISVYHAGTKIYGIEPGSGGGTPPPPSTPQVDIRLNSFALYSTDTTTIKENCVFNGGGAVGSNVFVEIKNEAVINGNIVSGSNATLWHRVVINGDITLGGTLTQSGLGNIFNNLQEGVTVATLTLTDFPVTTNSDHITVMQDSTRELGPGFYGDLNVLQNGILKLSPGDYTFGKFYIENGAKVIFQIDDYQDRINVSSAGEFSLQDRAELKFSSLSYAPSVQIYSRDQNELRIGVDVKTVGIITAPFATVNMYTGARCDGAIYAKIINVEPGAIVNSALVDPNRDDDGDSVPNGIEINPLVGTDPRNPKSYKPVAIPRNVVIDNSNKMEVIEYRLLPFYENYPVSSVIRLFCPKGALKDPFQAPIIQIVNKPSTGNSGIIDSLGYYSAGQYVELLGNPVKKDSSVIIALPLPENSIPGDYNIGIIGDPGIGGVIAPGDIFDLPVEIQDSLKNVGGAIGKIVGPPPGSGGGAQNVSLVPIMKKTGGMVAYFDDGTVFSTAAYVELNINALIILDDEVDVQTGEITINYIDYSDLTKPAGVADNFKTTLRGSEVFLRVSPFENRKKIAGKIKVTGFTLSINGSPEKTVTKTLDYDVQIGESFNFSLRSLLYSDLPVYKEENLSASISPCIAFESQSFAGEGLIKGTPGKYTFSYFLQDHLGSTRMVLSIDKLGGTTVKEALMYQPYGAVSDVQGITTSGKDPLRQKFTTKEFDENGPDFGQIELNIALDFALTHSDATKPNRVEVYYADAPSNPEIVYVTIDPDNSKGKVTATLNNATSRTIASIQFKLNDETLISNVQSINELTNPGTKLTISQTFTGVSGFLPTVPKTFLNYSNESFYMAGIGAYHFGAREYDPEIGRWLSVDPNAQYADLYNYCGGNPIIMLDKDGRDAAVYQMYKEAGGYDNTWRTLGNTTPEGKLGILIGMGIISFSVAPVALAAYNGGWATADGFLLKGIEMTLPFTIPVIRFGSMAGDKARAFTINPFNLIGRSPTFAQFFTRTFCAVKPGWNRLTVLNFGRIPANTPLQLGVVAPQGGNQIGLALQLNVSPQLI